MGKPRELLIELIGEEEYEKYMKGDSIRVQRSLEDNDNFYTIERKRGYADIVRTRKVRVSDSNFFSTNYGIRIIGNYVGPQPDSEPRPQPQQSEERFHTRTDSGRLKAWNIDDAVASFIVAVKNDKVNWGCGNIDVRLPSSMPPKDLGPLTFLKRGIQTTLYAILMATDKIKNKAVSGNTWEFILVLAGWWVLNIVIGVILVAPLDEGELLSPFWDTYLGWTVIKALPFYGLAIATKYYSIWRTGWEVKMK